MVSIYSWRPKFLGDVEAQILRCIRKAKTLILILIDTNHLHQNILLRGSFLPAPMTLVSS